VTQPVLDCADWYAGFMPSRGARLAKTMEIEVFANRPVFARNFDLFSLIVSAFGDDRSILATVQACVFRDAFLKGK
jgi:hypothetical protein